MKGQNHSIIDPHIEQEKYYFENLFLNLLMNGMMNIKKKVFYE